MEDHVPVLRVFLLGAFRVEVEQPDGTRRVIEDFEALLGRGLSAILFKLILMHPERRVKRDVLARAIWPGRSLASIRHSLEVTKSQLTRTLEELCGCPLLPRVIGNPPVYATASQELLWTDLEAVNACVLLRRDNFDPLLVYCLFLSTIDNFSGSRLHQFCHSEDR